MAPDRQRPKDSRVPGSRVQAWLPPHGDCAERVARPRYLTWRYKFVTVPTVGRPKQFDPDAAAEQAMEVFWRKGYAATTPQDLVDALGIGKGSLYNAFGSKHELFELALRRYRDSQGAALLEMLEEPGPVKARLRKPLGVLAEMAVAAPKRRGCMAVNAAAELAGTDEPVTDLVRRMFDRMEEAFRWLVEEGQRTG